MICVIAYGINVCSVVVNVFPNGEEEEVVLALSLYLQSNGIKIGVKFRWFDIVFLLFKFSVFVLENGFRSGLTLLAIL